MRFFTQKKVIRCVYSQSVFSPKKKAIRCVYSPKKKSFVAFIHPQKRSFVALNHPEVKRNPITWCRALAGLQKYKNKRVLSPPTTISVKTPNPNMVLELKRSGPLPPSPPLFQFWEKIDFGLVSYYLHTITDHYLRCTI